MNTLIVYGTKHGASEKCAKLLSERLQGKVDLVRAGASPVPNPDGYDRIIVGGSVYAGRIQKEVADFCRQYLSILKQKKVGLYISCMMKNQDLNKQIEANFPKELQAAAVAIDGLGCELKMGELNFMEKTITKMVSKMLSKDDPSMALDPKKDLLNLEMAKIERFAAAMNV